MIPEHCLEELSEGGLFVVDDWLPDSELESVQMDFERFLPEFRPAGIGRGADVAPTVRGDRILWWGEARTTPQEVFWNRLEFLRLGLNQSLFLGLERFEVHYAWYPAGGQYDWHMDTRMDGSSRRITFVFYLNKGWGPGDGGELEIREKNIRIEPRLNRLVVFRSEKMLHRVLVSHKDRKSVTGWFHVRSSP